MTTTVTYYMVQSLIGMALVAVSLIGMMFLWAITQPGQRDEDEDELYLEPLGVDVDDMPVDVDYEREAESKELAIQAWLDVNAQGMEAHTIVLKLSNAFGVSFAEAAYYTRQWLTYEVVTRLERLV